LLFVGIRKEEDYMGDTWHPKEEREGTRLSRSIYKGEIILPFPLIFILWRNGGFTPLQV